MPASVAEAAVYTESEYLTGGTARQNRPEAHSSISLTHVQLSNLYLTLPSTPSLLRLWFSQSPSGPGEGVQRKILTPIAQTQVLHIEDWL